MTGDFVKSLDVFDRLLLNALSMADYLASGFIQYLTIKSGAVTTQYHCSLSHPGTSNRSP